MLAEAQESFLCKSHIFRRVRKVFVEETWRVFEVW